MRPHVSKILAFSLILAGACAGSQSRANAPQAATAETTPAAAHAGLQIKHASVYVDDQEKALRFYTEVLGFTKKDDFTNGSFRWLTVTSPADPNGTELQLALDSDPAAKAYQQAVFQQGQPAMMFYSNDVKADYERMKAHGAEFTMPPTDVTMSTIATLKDTCGNLIQITELHR